MGNTFSKMTTVGSQIITALYETHASYTVPPGVDINDKKNVCWYIRWNTLYIDTKDGRHFEIDGDEYGLKCPEEVYDDDDDKIDFNESFDSSSEEEDDSDDNKMSVDCCSRKVKEEDIVISSENTKICPVCWT